MNALNHEYLHQPSNHMNSYTILIIPLLFSLSCCQPNTNPEDQKQSSTVTKEEIVEAKPRISFTFDDGVTTDILSFTFEEWNNMILSALDEADLKAAFFVTGANKLNKKGKYLLQSWANNDHLIANHTFTHANFNSDKYGVDDFEEELVRTDEVISQYKTYTRLFRFPYLKEGNTIEKIDGYRSVLKEHGYKHGYVTVDASDWYINSELIKCIKKEGLDSPKIDLYRDYYLSHIMDRAKYYQELSYEMTHRQIAHTLLLHHNLSSALFLGDLIDRFEEEGWKVIDADVAFQDEIFESIPDINPAGESLIWALAKETGNYEGKLRYPAEDSRYEIPKMKALGL